MNKKYGIVIKKKIGEKGLTKEDIIDMLAKIEGSEVYPYEVLSRQYEVSAIGFITPDSARQVDFCFEESGLNDFIKDILENKNEIHNEFHFEGINIFFYK